MDQGVDGESASGALQAHAGLELVKEGFNHESFAQQHVVQQGQQVVLHVAANASDQVKAPLPEVLQQRLGQIPLSAKIFPCRAVVMASSGLRSSLLPSVILKAMIWPL